MSGLDFVFDVIGVLGLSIYYCLIGLLKYWFPSTFAKNVAGDIIVITGGGSGIGRLMAKKLAKLGAKIVTIDINRKGNEETVEEITNTGGVAFAYTCDISKKDHIYSTAEKIKEEVGHPSMLINNAGIVTGKHILNAPDDKIELTFKVNVLAHFWTTKAFLPAMIDARKGHIVTIASLAGHFGANKLVDYCSSKFAAVGFDESLRLELDTTGHSGYIKTTCINPYFINTGMFDGTKSKILPILEPEYVVDRALEGILTDTEVVMIPRMGWYLAGLKALMPTEASTASSIAFGTNCAMDDFVGRGDSGNNNKKSK